MKTERHNIIFAGLGGMGALTSGQLLAKAAMKKYRHVTWYPNITTARRNAPADCVVCFSDEMIYSQLVNKVETAVVMNNSQLNVLSDRIETDGLLIMEDDDLANGLERNDVKAIRVPGIKISSEIANPRVINTVYLGVYVGASQTVPFDLVKDELQQRFKEKEDILRINVQAFEEGFRFGEAA